MQPVICRAVIDGVMTFSQASLAEDHEITLIVHYARSYVRMMCKQSKSGSAMQVKLGSQIKVLVETLMFLFYILINAKIIHADLRNKAIPCFSSASSQINVSQSVEWIQNTIQGYLS